jgi:superfamily II DNA or RNA helicase
MIDSEYTPARRSVEWVEEGFRKDPEFEAFLPHQRVVLDNWEKQDCIGKHLVFYPTGKGKTKIMLGMVAMSGYGAVVVVAPPITHNKWVAEGRMVGLRVIAVSHAKFRMSDFRLQRKTPVIVDEFHLLGGHTGKGWTKLDRAAAGLQAPLILGSATPNYNDAERCYCLVHVLSPFDNRGGYLTWLYDKCITRNNPHSPEPYVDGFRAYKDASDYLSSQPFVSYLPDDAPDIIVPYPVAVPPLPDEFSELNLDSTRERVMASMMEIRQRSTYRQIIGDDDQLRIEVAEAIGILLDSMPDAKWLIFCARREIALRVFADIADADYSAVLIDGEVTQTQKMERLNLFLAGNAQIMVGTASMATGTDGIDKVCKHMMIVDDTDDDSLRRQLVGRILPRGIVTQDDYVGRVAYRFEY